MATEKEVLVLCYWDGCVKHGPDGLYYEGTTHRKISVKKKTGFRRLLDGLYLITGFDKQRSKLDLFGRYPLTITPHTFKYVHLPVVDDSSLEMMLDVPSNHPSLNSVELYLELKTTSDDAINPAACSSPLEDPGTSSKRQRTQQPQEANGCVDMDVTHPPVKLEMEDNIELVEDETNAGGDGGMSGNNSGSDAVAHVVNLTGDSSVSHMKDSNSGVSKPCVSSLWIDDHDWRVGLCFKDSYELKKAVDWCSINGQKKCVIRETGTDEYLFECVRWKCKWSLEAAKMEHGLIEIVKYTGPHTCDPAEPEAYEDPEFVADEIEHLLRVHPTLSFAELKKWWVEKIGFDLETSDVRSAKEAAIERVFGDWDQSFEDLSKLMSAFHSSNGLLVDWKYDTFPNPKFASFCGVFWAFSQSVEGFHHCRPLIVVDTKNLNGEYKLKLMIASGVDANNKYFPLAFAVTKEVCTDSWRWFLNGIREKVTQRKDICLISAPNPDICAVINEPLSLWKEPWAYHRLCLDRLCSQFHGIFRDNHLDSLVKQAGSTRKMETFDSCMKNIEVNNPEARKWLDQIPPHKWALVHDSGRRYEVMRIDTAALFDVCRSFQLPRHVVTGSMLLLFDELRSSFDNSRSLGRVWFNYGDVYTQTVMNKLERVRASSASYIVMPLENNAFQVTARSRIDEWIVQLSNCTCTCGEFQNCKLPCLHALAVCKKLKMNPLQYVDDCYTIERYNKTYAATFAPVPELSAWPEATEVPRMFPPVMPPPVPPPTKVGKTTTRTYKKKS